jgi:hypothetical protein
MNDVIHWNKNIYRNKEWKLLGRKLVNNGRKAHYKKIHIFQEIRGKYENKFLFQK